MDEAQLGSVEVPHAQGSERGDEEGAASVNH
jgi:hypothetical protein